MVKGIYCLLLENEACTLPIGRLGDISFEGGWHIYVGSALGPGGISRVDRHVRLAKSRDRIPHWHIDYILMDPHFQLSDIVWADTESRLECALAGTLGGPSVPRFGASDCSCTSHLFYRPRMPLAEVEAGFTMLSLSCHSKRINSPRDKDRV